jgi:Zn-dependent peptidase ImmA (M78 family)
MFTPDYHKASTMARRVLRENNIVRPPVAPRELAEAYGLTVSVVSLSDLPNVAGFMDFTDSTIYVNGDDHYNRQTFTIAHELGHYLLHKPLFEAHPEKYKVLMRAPLGAEQDPIEKEANAFAADLLVPLDLLKLYGKYATEDDLARLFAVSNEVIRYRLKFARQPAFAE